MMLRHQINMNYVGSSKGVNDEKVFTLFFVRIVYSSCVWSIGICG
ncbi:hypothetical protein CMALT430_490025 [Carnobacterium maltaromaticum]|nr:hypothetical protein CMALT430_490025 [Carnobacterium maltaromaticum]